MNSKNWNRYKMEEKKETEKKRNEMRKVVNEDQKRNEQKCNETGVFEIYYNYHRETD